MRPSGRGAEPSLFRRAARSARLALLGLALLAVAACTPLYRDHGYAPTEAELKAVTVGKDTRETVTAAVGRPSASGVLSDKRWYYVQSRYKQRGPYAAREIERQVVVITFAESGTVANIERFGLEDGQVVALSRRVTESNIEGVSFLGQLLGNFGRLTGQQLLPGGGQP
jgi:outer membrane protein assembly factor BamE (lipoprotein component of BamABCDE complex)